MPNKPRAATGRSTVKRVAKSAIPNGAQDVTSESPDDLVSRIKLICDNDINVHLFRADGKL